MEVIEIECIFFLIQRDLAGKWGKVAGKSEKTASIPSNPAGKVPKVAGIFQKPAGNAVITNINLSEPPARRRFFPHFFLKSVRFWVQNLHY